MYSPTSPPGSFTPNAATRTPWTMMRFFWERCTTWRSSAIRWVLKNPPAITTDMSGRSALSRDDQNPRWFVTDKLPCAETPTWWCRERKKPWAFEDGDYAPWWIACSQVGKVDSCIRDFFNFMSPINIASPPFATDNKINYTRFLSQINLYEFQIDNNLYTKPSVAINSYLERRTQS